MLRLLRFKLPIFQREEHIILYTEIQTSKLKLLTKNFAVDLFRRTNVIEKSIIKNVLQDMR